MDDSWVFVPAVVKGGHEVTMAIDTTDIVAFWPTRGGTVCRHSNGGTSTVLMRAAEVAELLGVVGADDDEWFAGVAE